MRLYKLLFFSFVFGLLTSATKAQYPGMRAVYANMDRQFAAQQMQMNMTMMGRYYDGILYNYKYTFKVIMKDSSKQEVSSKIYIDTTLHKSYLIYENKKLKKSDSLRRQRIYPEETLSISRDLVNSFVKPLPQVTGMANDSCWLFKVITGRSITVYSYLSVMEGGYLEPVTVAAIQQNGGPIMKVNKENLEAMITGDQDAIKALFKNDYLKAINVYNRNFIKATRKHQFQASRSVLIFKLREPQMGLS